MRLCLASVFCPHKFCLCLLHGFRVCIFSRLEIMEQMAVLQETSYELLYRWAQSECTTHNDHVVYMQHDVSTAGLDRRKYNIRALLIVGTHL